MPKSGIQMVAVTRQCCRVGVSLLILHLFLGKEVDKEQRYELNFEEYQEAWRKLERTGGEGQMKEAFDAVDDTVGTEI